MAFWSCLEMAVRISIRPPTCVRERRNSARPLHHALADWTVNPSQEASTLLDLVRHQLHLAGKARSKEQTAQYKSWLEGAESKHMKPLFRAIRSHEAIVLRPHREAGLELRPFLRLQHWLTVWRGVLEDTSPELSDGRLQLQDLAKQQSQGLPPVPMVRLQKACAKKRQKAPGPDGWSYDFLNHLPEEACQELWSFYHEMEDLVQVPLQFKMQTVSLLPKSPEAERPISLTHVPWRQWCRLRWDLLQNWVEVYRQQAPWDSAVPGHSSLDVGVRRVLRAECFQIKNKPFASIFIDISGFYDNVQWSDIRSRRFGNGHPSRSMA